MDIPNTKKEEDRVLETLRRGGQAIASEIMSNIQIPIGTSWRQMEPKDKKFYCLRFEAMMRTKGIPAHHAINFWIARKYITDFYRGKRNSKTVKSNEKDDVRKA
jgi:hypothetical protein